MRHMYGYRLKEIAEDVELSLAATRMVLTRAREDFRDAVDREVALVAESRAANTRPVSSTPPSVVFWESPTDDSPFSVVSPSSLVPAANEEVVAAFASAIVDGSLHREIEEAAGADQDLRP